MRVEDAEVVVTTQVYSFISVLLFPIRVMTVGVIAALLCNIFSLFCCVALVFNKSENFQNHVCVNKETQGCVLLKVHISLSINEVNPLLKLKYIFQEINKINTPRWSLRMFLLMYNWIIN